MKKIVYKKTDGKAHDLRFVKSDYAAKNNETIIEGDKLPDINTLHSAEYIGNLNSEAQRIGSIDAAINTIRDIYKYQKKSDISDEHIMELQKLEKAREWGLEL